MFELQSLDTYLVYASFVILGLLILAVYLDIKRTLLTMQQRSALRQPESPTEHMDVPAMGQRTFQEVSRPAPTATTVIIKAIPDFNHYDLHLISSPSPRR